MALFSFLPHVPLSEGRIALAHRVGVHLAGDAGGRFVERAAGSRYLRNVAMLMGGTALGQGVVVAASPILTRLYTPADFGILAAYAAILSLVVVVSSLRYDVAVPLANEDEGAANLLALSLGAVLVTSVLVALAVILFGNQLVRIGGTEGLQPYLWLLPLSVIGAGVYQALLGWAVRKEAMGAIARTKLSQGIGMVVTQLGLGVLSAGPAGLLVGWAVGQASGGGTLAMLGWRQDRSVLKRVSMAGMRWVAVRYRRWAVLSTGSAFLNSVVLGVPVLFLSSGYGLTVAGSYALGQRIVGVPMLLVGSSMSQVYLAEAFRLAREDPLQLERLFLQTAKRLLLVGTLPILGLTLTAPWTFTVIFGSQWRDAGLYLMLLAPMLLVQFVSSQLSGTLDVLERQDLFLFASVARLALMVVAVVLASLLRLGDLAAIGLLGAMTLLGYVTYTALCWYALLKRRGELPQEEGGEA